MRKIKIDEKLKQRIQKGYDAIAKADGKDTTEWEKQILRLEKRYVEQTLAVTLTNPEIEDLKTICTVKAVFPGAKVVGISSKKFSQMKRIKGGD